MTKPLRKLLVPICYADEDEDTICKYEIYDRLKKEAWIHPWFRKEDLFPGQDKEYETKKIIKKADLVIFCFSKKTKKEGRIYKEIKAAIETESEKTEGTIFIIPLLLDGCDVPRELNKYQHSDYFKDGAHEKLLGSLKIRAETVGMKNVQDSFLQVELISGRDADNETIENSIVFVLSNSLSIDKRSISILKHRNNKDDEIIIKLPEKSALKAERAYKNGDPDLYLLELRKFQIVRDPIRLSSEIANINTSFDAFVVKTPSDISDRNEKINASKDDSLEGKL